MPANLTHRYRVAEQAYRRATEPAEVLRCLQQMLIDLPKHKGTDKMQADLKQKISRAKKELAAAQSTSASKAGQVHRIPRQGAGRAVIIGPANAGKSQLQASLTRAKPEIAPYPFTTREPAPAMMPWEDVSVQLIDTPPITEDVFGANVQQLIRTADLAILVLDLGSDDGGQELMQTWNRIGASKTRLATESYFDENDIGVSYTRCMMVNNKIDLPDAKDRLEFFSEFVDTGLPTFNVSALKSEGTETLRDAIYGALDVLRIYTKLPREKEADFEKPFTLQRGQTVADLAALIHQDFVKSLRTARVWSKALPGVNIVNPDYELVDQDIVELQLGG